MPLTPEQIREKVSADTIAAGEEQTAVLLKKQFQNLAQLYPEIVVPESDNEAEYRRMGRELIDKRLITVSTKNGGTFPISLDDLDQKDNDLGGAIKKSRGVSNLQQLVPTRAQLEATAEAVSEGVEENTGLIKGTSLSNLIAGFFAWLGNILAWMVNGFKGDSPSLGDTIAKTTADNMQESVTKNLQKLRDENPQELQSILDDTVISGVSREVHNRVLKEAGLQVVEPPKVALKDVPFETLPGAMPTLNISPPMDTPPIAGLTAEQRVSQRLGEMSDSIMANLSGKVTAEELAKAQAMKPAIVEAGAQAFMQNPDLARNPEAFTNAVMQGLQERGISLENPRAKMFIAFAVKQHLEGGYGNLLAQAAKGESSLRVAEGAPGTPPLQVKLDPLEAMGIKDPAVLIADKVAEQIKTEAIEGVIKSYNEAGAIKRWMMGAPEEAIATINNYKKHYLDRDAGVIAAENTIYQWAVENEYAPNDKQRYMIGKIVADASVETLSTPKYKDASRQHLAGWVQINIQKKLQAGESEISRLGASVEDINHRVIGDNADLLGDIHRNIGETLYNPNRDKEGLYAMAKAVQQSELAKLDAARNAMLAAADQAVDPKTRETIRGSEGPARLPEGKPLANLTPQSSTEHSAG